MYIIEKTEENIIQKLFSKIAEDVRGNKYITLYNESKPDTPLCILNSHEWNRLTREVYDNMLNFEDDKEE